MIATGIYKYFMTQPSKKINHIALIMDGNRRWAKEKGLPKMMGHTEGAKNMKHVIRTLADADIPYITLWALSTENLKREEKELKHLFSLFEKLVDYIGDLQKENIKFQVIGNLSLLPESVQETLANVIENTKENTGTTVTLAVAYGGRDELLRATKKLLASGISADEITDELFEKNLDTADMPDVDLVVRTGGHQRLSGYLPWQAIYAELYFTNTYWPALKENELKDIVEWFYTQKRNGGK